MIENVTEEMAVELNVTGPLIPDGCLAAPVSSYAPWNNPEDLISHSTLQLINEMVDVYVLTPIFLVTVPCNIINMIVFWNHGLKERINLCLFFLSLADVLVVVVQMTYKLDRLYATITDTPPGLAVAKVMINNMFQSLTGFSYVSGFMSTLIALERCLCVVSPLRAQTMFRTKTTAVIIAVGHVVMIGGYVVVATKWRVLCLFDPATGVSVDAYYSSGFYVENKQLVDVLNGVVYGLLLRGSFVLGVSVSTVLTVLKLRQMTEWRQQSSVVSAADTSAAKDVTLTRMLMGTNLVFVACTAPPLVIQIVTTFENELSLSGKYYNTYYLFVIIHQLSSFVNSSFNFFVYYSFGTKFRTTVKLMFSSRKKSSDWL